MSDLTVRPFAVKISLVHKKVLAHDKAEAGVICLRMFSLDLEASAMGWDMGVEVYDPMEVVVNNPKGNIQ